MYLFVPPMRTNNLLIEGPPQFIKGFSKKESPGERQQTAQAIRGKRAEYFTEKRTQTEWQAELQQTTSERALVEQVESVRNLENEITKLSTSKLGKILNYFRLQKLRADVAIRQRGYDASKQQQNIKIAEEQAISEKSGFEETQPALQEAKTILDNFYKGQKEKWAGSEYTR